MGAWEPTLREPLRALLVSTDFSKGAERALERALLLPLAPEAKVHIVHVLPRHLPAKLRPKAESEARRRLEQVLSEVRKRKAGTKINVTSEILCGETFVEILRTSRSRSVELIVLGRHGRRPIRDMFIGTTAERVVRKGDVPILVVNLKPTHPYRHPLIATDLENSSRRAVDLALRVLDTNVKRVNVVHAFQVPFEGFVTASASPGDKIEWRRSYQRTAVTGMSTFLAPYQHSGVLWKTFIRQGDPRSVVLAAAARCQADLIALGTHGKSGIAHALLGSVAEWVITAATCDVLVAKPIRISVELP
jgi:nucleotide-binding universal stress UspA family protein